MAFTAERQDIAKAVNFINSDIDFCEYEGYLIINYSWGSQLGIEFFDQFHDFLTGSGIVDTREHALGEFQKAMATAITNAAKAMRLIAVRIDTSDIAADTDNLRKFSDADF